jgi:hypothetical protein
LISHNNPQLAPFFVRVSWENLRRKTIDIMADKDLGIDTVVPHHHSSSDSLKDDAIQPKVDPSGSDSNNVFEV